MSILTLRVRLWIGLQNTHSVVNPVLQPVLTYNNPAQSGRGGWEFVAWNCCPAGHAFYATAVDVPAPASGAAAPSLTGAIAKQADGSYTVSATNSDTGQMSSLRSTDDNDGLVDGWNWMEAVLEVYNVTSCAGYARGDWAFTNMVATLSGGATVTPAWVQTVYASHEKGDTYSLLSEAQAKRYASCCNSTTTATATSVSYSQNAGVPVDAGLQLTPLPTGAYFSAAPRLGTADSSTMDQALLACARDASCGGVSQNGPDDAYWRKPVGSTVATTTYSAGLLADGAATLGAVDSGWSTHVKTANLAALGVQARAAGGHFVFEQGYLPGGNNLGSATMDVDSAIGYCSLLGPACHGLTFSASTAPAAGEKVDIFFKTAGTVGASSSWRTWVRTDSGRGSYLEQQAGKGPKGIDGYTVALVVCVVAIAAAAALIAVRARHLAAAGGAKQEAGPAAAAGGGSATAAATASAPSAKNLL